MSRVELAVDDISNIKRECDEKIEFAVEEKYLYQGFFIRDNSGIPIVGLVYYTWEAESDGEDEEFVIQITINGVVYKGSKIYLQLDEAGAAFNRVVKNCLRRAIADGHKLHINKEIR